MKKINKSQFQSVVNSCPQKTPDDADEFATTTHPVFNGSNDYLPTFHWTDNYFPRPPDNQLLTPADLPYISKYTINMIDQEVPSMILEFSNNRDPLTITDRHLMQQVVDHIDTRYPPANYYRFNRSQW